MKIGILTYHKSINYGSVLQAWALQNILQSIGCDAEIIDYEPKKYKTHYCVYLPNDNWKRVIRNLLRIPLARYRKAQFESFAYFRKHHLNCSTEKYSYLSDLKKLEEDYDCIICGSDQIWNVLATDCDDAFFLPNINIKKIAYAISVNRTTFKEDRCNADMKRWISSFDFISCREMAGAKRIEDFIEHSKEVHTLPDPTLLHDKKDYEDIVSERIIGENYIFLYKVWNGEDCFDAARRVGINNSMKVYTILNVNDYPTLCRIERYGIKVLKNYTSPEDFLSLIKYASIVITDSFHGTAFSIIFEKQFICVRERLRDGTLKNDERIMGILETFGLEKRYIQLVELDNISYNEMIDYTKVTSKRMNMSNQTMDILKIELGNKP